jgi:predicted small secreted protein
MRKLFGMVVVAGALMVSACNTVEGVGRDVSSAGDTVAKTADGAKCRLRGRGVRPRPRPDRACAR